VKCFICDRELGLVRIDSRDGKARPCPICEEVIAETVDDYDREQRDSEFIEDLTQTYCDCD